MEAFSDVLEAVIGQVAAHPRNLALKDGDRELSYGQLGDEVATTATGLLERGTCAGDRIVLLLSNSVDYVVAALACMAVDAAFVPLNVADPASRVAMMINDCRPRLIISESAQSTGLEGTLRLGDLQTSGRQPFRVRGAEVPAYLIYTSGTTGAPKGVVIGRRAFAASINSTVRALGFCSRSRSMSVSKYNFGGSLSTLFGTLSSGGFLLIPPSDSLLFPRYFLRTIIDQAITSTSFTPGYLRLLLTSKHLADIGAGALGILAIGGDVCSARDLERLHAVAPGLVVYNKYGSTETTSVVSHHLVSDDEIARGGPLPIGRPHDGVVFYRFSDSGEPVHDPAVPGELYVGGVQLMDGYWNAPELTSAVLRSDIVPGERVYRTGDLVTVSDVDEYTHRGRIGSVVKRNSMRISLVELADVLGTTPGVASSACTTYDNDGDTGIVAFVVPEPGVAMADVRRRYAERLPNSAVPDLILVADRIPLTSRNKIDERALLTSAGLTRGVAHEYR